MVSMHACGSLLLNQRLQGRPSIPASSPQERIDPCSPRTPARASHSLVKRTLRRKAWLLDRDSEYKSWGRRTVPALRLCHCAMRTVTRCCRQGRPMAVDSPALILLVVPACEGDRVCAVSQVLTVKDLLLVDRGWICPSEKVLFLRARI